MRAGHGEPALPAVGVGPDPGTGDSPGRGVVVGGAGLLELAAVDHEGVHLGLEEVDARGEVLNLLVHLVQVAPAVVAYLLLACASPENAGGLLQLVRLGENHLLRKPPGAVDEAIVRGPKGEEEAPVLDGMDVLPVIMLPLIDHHYGQRHIEEVSELRDDIGRILDQRWNTLAPIASTGWRKPDVVIATARVVCQFDILVGYELVSKWREPRARYYQNIWNKLENSTPVIKK